MCGLAPHRGVGSTNCYATWPKNIGIKSPINCFTLWENFLVHDAINVKEVNQYLLDSKLQCSSVVVTIASCDAVIAALFRDHTRTPIIRCQ